MEKLHTSHALARHWHCCNTSTTAAFVWNVCHAQPSGGRCLLLEAIWLFSEDPVARAQWNQDKTGHYSEILETAARDCVIQVYCLPVSQRESVAHPWEYVLQLLAIVKWEKGLTVQFLLLLYWYGSCSQPKCKEESKEGDGRHWEGLHQLQNYKLCHRKGK